MSTEKPIRSAASVRPRFAPLRRQASVAATCNRPAYPHHPASANLRPPRAALRRGCFVLPVAGPAPFNRT